MKIYKSILSISKPFIFIFFQINLILPVIASSSSVPISSTSKINQAIEIKKHYSHYKKNKNQFYTSNLNKKNFKVQLDLYINGLNNSLAIINQIEATSQPYALSPEGNQLALDYELLKPLQNLAMGQIDKKSCDASKALNVKNTGQDKKNFDLIYSVIQKICN